MNSDWSIAKAQAYGGVLINLDGQVLLREPANHFDGYVWTFPKGKQDKGESAEQTALREVLEEVGYSAKVVGVLPGSYQSGLSSNAYFVMRPDGEQRKTDWETQATRWVGFDDAEDLIKLTVNSKGRERDLKVLAAAKVWATNNCPASNVAMHVGAISDFLAEGKS